MINRVSHKSGVSRWPTDLSHVKDKILELTDETDYNVAIMILKNIRKWLLRSVKLNYVTHENHLTRFQNSWDTFVFAFCFFAGKQRKAWEKTSVATSILWFMPHTKACRLQPAASSTTSELSSVLSPSMPVSFVAVFSIIIVNWKLFYAWIRLKQVSGEEENDRSGNAAFLQILISFYIQSEVASLSLLYCKQSFPSKEE